MRGLCPKTVRFAQLTLARAVGAAVTPSLARKAACGEAGGLGGVVGQARLGPAAAVLAALVGGASSLAHPCRAKQQIAHVSCSAGAGCGFALSTAERVCQAGLASRALAHGCFAALQVGMV